MTSLISSLLMLAQTGQDIQLSEKICKRKACSGGQHDLMNSSTSIKKKKKKKKKKGIFNFMLIDVRTHGTTWTFNPQKRSVRGRWHQVAKCDLMNSSVYIRKKKGSLVLRLLTWEQTCSMILPTQ